MSDYGGNFGRLYRITQRIEMLTELLKKEPDNKDYKEQLKRAEDGLYRMMQKEERMIERYLESLNDEETWEE